MSVTPSSFYFSYATKPPGINTSPTNIRSKSPLKIVFSSWDTYFCFSVIAVFALASGLWYLPLGEVSILKGLVPQEKRESIGLILAIGSIVLMILCILHIMCSIYEARQKVKSGVAEPEVGGVEGTTLAEEVKSSVAEPEVSGVEGTTLAEEVKSSVAEPEVSGVEGPALARGINSSVARLRVDGVNAVKQPVHGENSPAPLAQGA